MKFTVKHIVENVAKSLDFNTLKYVSDKKINDMVDDLEPLKDKKSLGNKILDAAFCNADSYSDIYYMQGSLDENGTMHGPYPSDDLDIENNHLWLEEAPENPVSRNISDNLSSIFSFSSSLLEDTESLSKVESKHKVSGPNSFNKPQYLHPFKVGKQGEKMPVFDLESSNNLYDSADLALCKFETILLNDLLTRLDEKIYKSEQVVGKIIGTESKQDSVFIKYGYLKNVMDWTEEKNIEVQRSSYSNDSKTQDIIAYSNIPPKKAEDIFKSFFNNKIKSQKLLGNFSKNKFKRSLPRNIYKKSLTKKAKITPPKRNPSRLGSKADLFKSAHLTKSKSLSRSSLQKLRHIPNLQQSINPSKKDSEKSKDFQAPSNYNSISVDSLGSYDISSSSSSKLEIPVRGSSVPLSPQLPKSGNFKPEKPLLKQLSQKRAKELLIKNLPKEQDKSSIYNSSQPSKKDLPMFLSKPKQKLSFSPAPSTFTGSLEFSSESEISTSNFIMLNNSTQNLKSSSNSLTKNQKSEHLYDGNYPELSLKSKSQLTFNEDPENNIIDLYASQESLKTH